MNITSQYIFIYIYIYKLANFVKGNLKASISLATTLRCKEGCYSYPWIAPLYSWSVPYNAKC